MAKVLRNPYTPRERTIHRATCDRWAEAARAAHRPALALRFEECGSGLWATHEGEQVLTLDGNAPVRRVMTCNHRNCPTCARKRSARIREALQPHVADVAHGGQFQAKPALLTLTIDDREGETLPEATGRIQAAWKKMRRRKGWHSRVRGGFYALEVTRNVKRGSWHVHLHAVIDVDWLGQAEALEMWREALGSGERCGGVNIQRVRNGISEATKYLTKGVEASRLPLAQRAELLRWMHGRRMLATFGHLYGLQLADDDDGPEAEGVEATEGSEPVGYNPRTGQVLTAAECEWLGSFDVVERGFEHLARWWEANRGIRPPPEGGRRGAPPTRRAKRPE